MNTRSTFKERFQQAMTDILRKQEVKALMKTLPTAEYVTMKVTGSKEVRAYSDRGWEMVTAIDLGRGAGFGEYIMRKNRQLVADNA